MSSPVLEAILDELQQARRVLDIGCGSGILARSLTRRGFDVTGIDPQADLIERATASVPGADFLAASAADLPYPDACFDAAVFLNSLHHVAEPEMGTALAEAARVTHPEGRIIVVEPLAEGPLFEVMRPIDDETIIRGQAQAAMDRAALRPLTHRRFDRVTSYANMEAFTKFLLSGDPARADAINAASDALAAGVLRHAIQQDDGFSLVQPLLIRSFAPTPRMPM